MIKTGVQYRAVARSVRRYWRDYGAWRGVFTSPIFHFSLFLNVVCYNLWTTDKWANLTLALVPNILGFSLGTYALVFSLVTSRIRLALREVRARDHVSYLDELNSLFMHFLLTQLVAILFAILFSSPLAFDVLVGFGLRAGDASALLSPFWWMGSFVGSLLFLYALCSISGAAFAVYRLATLVDPDET